MKLYEFADRMNGNRYRDELTSKDVELAIENGIVIVFGYSDDGCEFRGAIKEEIGCFDGGKIYFNSEGSNFTDEHGNAPMSYMVDRDKPEDNMIEAVWCPDWLKQASWGYKTDIPHKKFYIYEDDKLFCEGIVFYKHDLK